MRRSLLAAAIVATGLGAALTANAQPYPPSSSDPPISYRIVRIIPGAVSDTRRNSPAANPDCGAANPQGGIPSSVTWGSCP